MIAHNKEVRDSSQNRYAQRKNQNNGPNLHSDKARFVLKGAPERLVAIQTTDPEATLETGYECVYMKRSRDEVHLLGSQECVLWWGLRTQRIYNSEKYTNLTFAKSEAEVLVFK